MEQGGRELLDVEERLRLLNRALRADPDGPEAEAREAEVERIVDGLDVAFETGVIRAFSIYFQLVNAAEQHHRVRRRQRDAEREAEAARSRRAWRPRSGHGGARRGARAGAGGARPHGRRAGGHGAPDGDHAPERPGQAHHGERLPRSSTRPTGRPGSAATPPSASWEAITILWQTDAMRAERPRVIDEVRRILFFFDHVLEDAAGAVHEELERLLAETYPPAPPRALLGFGSWAGGEQDGNLNCRPSSSGRRSTATARPRCGGCATACGPSPPSWPSQSGWWA